MPDRSRATDSRYLCADQYRDSRNLSARGDFHERFSTNPYPWFRWVFDHLQLPPRAQVLEVGCGSGRLWRQNLDRLPSGWEITLSDFSPGMLEDARKALAQAPHQFSFLVADAQDIPRPDESYDAVIADHMLYHVPSVPRALAEIRRVLRSDGRLYAATNGQTHMQELWQIVAEFAGMPSKAAVATRGFALDNGADLLAAQFAHVVLHPCEDALEVTEADPLVAYVLSIMDEAVVSRVAAQQDGFRAFVEALLACEPLHIGKSMGLFEAWN